MGVLVRCRKIAAASILTSAARRSRGARRKGASARRGGGRRNLLVAGEKSARWRGPGKWAATCTSVHWRMRVRGAKAVMQPRCTQEQVRKRRVAGVELLAACGALPPLQGAVCSAPILPMCRFIFSGSVCWEHAACWGLGLTRALFAAAAQGAPAAVRPHWARARASRRALRDPLLSAFAQAGEGR